jgi:hypothetical protein
LSELARAEKTSAIEERIDELKRCAARECYFAALSLVRNLCDGRSDFHEVFA